MSNTTTTTTPMLVNTTQTDHRLNGSVEITTYRIRAGEGPGQVQFTGRFIKGSWIGDVWEAKVETLYGERELLADTLIQLAERAVYEMGKKLPQRIADTDEIILAREVFAAAIAECEALEDRAETEHVTQEEIDDAEDALYDAEEALDDLLIKRGKRGK